MTLVSILASSFNDVGSWFLSPRDISSCGVRLSSRFHFCSNAANDDEGDQATENQEGNKAPEGGRGDQWQQHEKNWKTEQEPQGENNPPGRSPCGNLPKGSPFQMDMLHRSKP